MSKIINGTLDITAWHIICPAGGGLYIANINVFSNPNEYSDFKFRYKSPFLLLNKIANNFFKYLKKIMFTWITNQNSREQ